MPKYIIHVGPPKTGSKYIQSQLFHNREYLQAHGALYPDNWWNRPDKIFHDAVFEILRNGRAEELKPEFEKINQTGFEKVILSCEGFEGLNVGQLEQFREVLGNNPVEIIYYARRWSDRLPSDWRQQVMMGQITTFPEFYLSFLNTPESTSQFNYSLSWDHLCTAFDRQNLKIVSLSNLVDNGMDSFDHFCRTIVGLPEVPRTQFIQHNKGPGMFDTEILRCLNCFYSSVTSRFDVSMRIKFFKLKEKRNYELQEIYRHLQSDVHEIVVNDGAGSLGKAWEAIQSYQDCFVNPDADGKAFQPHEALVQFVGQDYLLRPGAVAELVRYYEYVQSQSVFTYQLQEVESKKS